MNVLVSVITVCFNSEKTIERTIKSVKEQTYKNIEYIIIDGKSSDRTMDIVRRYEPEFQGRLKFISEPDKGIYDAMNKGINMASGELIGIVNSDDYFESDAIEHIVDAYDGYEYDIIYGMLRTIRDGREVAVYIKNHELINEDMITHPTCFVCKKIYQKFGLYSLDYKYSSDYEFMLRMIRNKKIHFKKIYKIISNFSVDGVSSNSKAYKETLILRKRYGLISKYNYRLQMLKTLLVILIKH